MDYSLRLIVAVLATWRITHLLANEDGPADLVARFRLRLGSGLAGQLMDCFKCLSLWVALPIALFVTRRPLELLLTWVALSGAACLLERLGQEPIVIEQITKPEEEKDLGMLRTETNGYQEHAANESARHHTTSV
ncbi:MAG TPA: hypothetical protein VFR80_14535 [Pyrinomonadaceae bacterium]|nr:hypothetical protein [Pyrinomonadaceae bacterium]